MGNIGWQFYQSKKSDKNLENFSGYFGFWTKPWFISIGRRKKSNYAGNIDAGVDISSIAGRFNRPLLTSTPGIQMVTFVTRINGKTDILNLNVSDSNVS
jgi:hypothetical protein